MQDYTYRADALTHLCQLIAAYRDAMAAQSETFGAVRQSYARRVNRCRQQVRLAIFFIRENDYAGAWNNG